MQWEYQTVKLDVAGTWGANFDLDQTQEFTNRLGSQGWELVSSVAINEGGGYTKEVVFIFKRALNE